MPAAARAIGACSRDEPQPKFFPAITTLYGETNSSSAWNGTCPLGSPICAAGTPTRAYLPNILYSSGMAGLYVRYWAGMIWSVSTLSPRTNALPLITCCIGGLVGRENEVVLGLRSLRVEQERKSTVPRTDPIHRLEPPPATEQPLLGPPLAGEVEKHGTEEDRQYPLPRHSGDRHDEAEEDQQDAEHILTDD